MRSTIWHRIAYTGLFIALICSVLVGCGGGRGERAKVKGTVKFFDKTLTAGTVTFTAKDGRVGSATIDFNGNYEMGDAPIGDVVITVKVPSLGGAGNKAKEKPKPPPGVPEMKAPGGDAGTDYMPPSIDPSKIVQIPGKYGSVETSGLNYTVVKGEQTKDIVLTP